MTSWGENAATSWDAFTAALADALQPFVQPCVLTPFLRYQEACARLLYLYLAHADSDFEAVYATCSTAITVCAAVCIAGFEALDFRDSASDEPSLAVFEAFNQARPMFEILLTSLPSTLASLAREKYEEFGRLVAAVAATDNVQVGIPVIESLAGGMHAAVDRFAVIHPEHNGHGRVGSPAWEQRRRAWARGEV